MIWIMSVFSVLEKADERFIKRALGKLGWSDEEIHAGGIHGQEDFLLTSQRYPIFSVADGVTLSQLLIDKKEYPDPSPAGEVARIFCEAAMSAAEEHYERFQESDLAGVFKAGNAAAGEYNRAQGRTKETINYWDKDFYTATAAFAIVKERRVYWASICDSYIAHIGSVGSLRFISPRHETLVEAPPPQLERRGKGARQWAEETWHRLRNALDAEGRRIGYGVVTGEESAVRYLSTGSFELAAGDALVLVTDGFEPYLALPDFRALLLSGGDLPRKVREYTVQEIAEDPETYGHERSLIVAIP